MLRLSSGVCILLYLLSDVSGVWFIKCCLSLPVINKNKTNRAVLLKHIKCRTNRQKKREITLNNKPKTISDTVSKQPFCFLFLVSALRSDLCALKLTRCALLFSRLPPAQTCPVLLMTNWWRSWCWHRPPCCVTLLSWRSAAFDQTCSVDVISLVGASPD